MNQARKAFLGNQQTDNLAKKAIELDALQKMESAQIAAEVRDTARTLFAASIAPYLQALIMEPALAQCGGRPDVNIVRSFAALSVKIAPYLVQSQGRVNIDEAVHWGDLKVNPIATPVP